MSNKHIQRRDLIGKVVDGHAHVGINIKAFSESGFPYCSCVEDLYIDTLPMVWTAPSSSQHRRNCILISHGIQKPGN